MTTLAYPTIATRAAPGTLDWRLRANTQVATSPLNGSVQTLELPGARWMASISYEALLEVEAVVLQAWLVQLRGQANRFTMHNWARPLPRGTWAGTPLVNNEVGSPTLVQTGNTLWLKGFTAAATVKAGDYFGVNGELKMITADGTADGSGNLQVTFEPPLRSAPAHNAAITSTRPTATFMLTSPEVGWSAMPGQPNNPFTRIAFDAVEVFT